MIATYADDTATLASQHNPTIASTNLQHHLNRFEKWLKRWCIKANENKSTHITFSLKRETCPAVTLNGQHTPQRNCQILRHSPGPQADMAKTHFYQKKTAWIATPPHVLVHRKKVEAVIRKQNTNIRTKLS